MTNENLSLAIKHALARPTIIEAITQAVIEEFDKVQQLDITDLDFVIGSDRVNIREPNIVGVMSPDIHTPDPKVLIWDFHKNEELELVGEIRRKVIDAMRAVDVQSNTPYPAKFVKKIPQEDHDHE